MLVPSAVDIVALTCSTERFPDEKASQHYFLYHVFARIWILRSLRQPYLIVGILNSESGFDRTSTPSIKMLIELLSYVIGSPDQLRITSFDTNRMAVEIVDVQTHSNSGRAGGCDTLCKISLACSIDSCTSDAWTLNREILFYAANHAITRRRPGVRCV
jgi:hypothetical protein